MAVFCHRSRIIQASAAASGSVGAPRVNVRSILSLPTGNRLRAVIDEHPVPNLSMTMRTPSAVTGARFTAQFKARVKVAEQECDRLEREIAKLRSEERNAGTNVREASEPF